MRGEGCQWRVYASMRNGELEVKVVNQRHTCAGLGPVARDVENSQDGLRRVVPLHLFVTRETRTEEITDCIRINHDKKTTAKAARLTRSYLISDQLEHQRQQYAQIPSYLSMLQHFNPLVYIRLVTIQNSDAFQRLLICPGES